MCSQGREKWLNSITNHLKSLAVAAHSCYLEAPTSSAMQCELKVPVEPSFSRWAFIHSLMMQYKGAKQSFTCSKQVKVLLHLLYEKDTHLKSDIMWSRHNPCVQLNCVRVTLCGKHTLVKDMTCRLRRVPCVQLHCVRVTLCGQHTFL
jgi:hypothetical protein